MKSERIECLSEILEEIGVKATDEQIKQIAEDYALHLEMESEMSSYQFVGGSQKCDECERLKKQVAQKENEITKYRNSVKKRRNASDVWLDGDDVIYKLR